MLSFKISLIILADIRKLVNNNLSINGLIVGIIDICLALIITPSAPVVLKCKFTANFRAFKSSSIKVTFSNSVAKAIALASPPSTWVSKNF